MKRRTEDEIKKIAELKYLDYVGVYGLRDAMRVCTELKRKLTGEKKRRGGIC